MALIVERRIGARVVDDAKLLERQGKRQVNDLVVLIDKGGLGDTFPQPHGASLGKEMGGEGSHQYHDERQVQQHDGHPLVEPLLHDIGQRGHCEDGPQRSKPPSTIDVLTNKQGVTILLYDSSKPYTRDDQRV